MAEPIKVAAILHLENDHGHGILRGIGQFARHEPRLHVVKFNKSERLRPEFLRSLGVRGVITKISEPGEEAVLKRLRLPAVNISGERSTAIPTVNTDDRLVGTLVARYYHRRGFRAVAYCGNETHLASRLRRGGLEAEAARCGLKTFHHVLPREGEVALHPTRTRRAMAAWLARLPKPVGILAFNDLVANEVAAACLLGGLEVPRDIAILGVGNDLTRLAFTTVALSSIELDTGFIGRRAAELLFAHITSGSRPPAQELVPPLKIVTRYSTDRLAVDDDVVTRALEHVREHLGNTLYVGDVARVVGTSRRSLELRFQRSLRSSVYREVQRMRVERAQELLATADLTLGEIAYATGYENARHLGLAFKRQVGIAPRAFRESRRGPAANRDRT